MKMYYFDKPKESGRDRGESALSTRVGFAVLDHNEDLQLLGNILSVNPVCV